MSIKINTTIKKLDPSDNYKLIDSYNIDGLEHIIVKETTDKLDAWTLANGNLLTPTIRALVLDDGSGFSSWFNYDSANTKWVKSNESGVLLKSTTGTVATNPARLIDIGSNLELTFDQSNDATATIKWKGMDMSSDGSVQYPDVTSLNFGPNLTCTYDQNKLTVDAAAPPASQTYSFDYPLKETGDTISIDNDAYEPMVTQCSYLRMGHRTRLASKFGTDQYPGWTQSTDLMPPEHVISDGDGRLIVGDVFIPQALYNDDSTDYLVVVDLQLKGTAPSKGDIELMLYRMSSDNVDFQSPVLDIEGHPVGLRKHYAQGDDLAFGDDDLLTAVVNSGAKGSEEGFKIIVSHSFTANNYIYAERNTSVVISSLNTESSSSAIEAFEAHNQRKVDFTYAKVNSDILGFSNPMEQVIVLGDRPAGTTELDAHWDLELLNWVKYGIDNTATFTATEQATDGTQTGNAKWYLARYFSSEMAAILNGHSLDYSIDATLSGRGLKVSRFDWSGTGDPVFPLMTGFDQYGNPLVVSGWNETVDVEIFGEHSTTTSANHTGTFNSDGTKEFAIVIYPTNTLNKADGSGTEVVTDALGTVKISAIDLGPTQLFSGYRLNSVVPDLLQIAGEHIIIKNATTANKQTVYTFTSSGRAHLPLGNIIEGSMNVDLSGGHHDTLTFREQGNVKIHSTVQVQTLPGLANGQSAVVRVIPEFINDNGINSIIPNAQKEITVTGGGTTSYAMDWEFDVSVQANQKMIFYVSGDTSNAAAIVSTPAKPGVTVTIQENAFVTGGSSDEGTPDSQTNINEVSYILNNDTEVVVDYTGDAIISHRVLEFIPDHSVISGILQIDPSEELYVDASEAFTRYELPGLNKTIFKSTHPVSGVLKLITKGL